MKVLLLGGTGAMGSHLSHILKSRKGIDIAITTRSPRESADTITYLTGNAHDETFLNEVLSVRWDVIVDFMVYATEEFKNRVEKLLGSCSQYIFLSSSRVYAGTETRITERSARLLDVCEDNEYLATDEYALAKARQENLLIESQKNNWTVIRPYITFAENRLQLGVLELKDWLYRALLGHSIVFSEDIFTHYTTMTYGLDVARAMASVMFQESAYGKTFHITVNEPKKWSDILNLYLEVIEEETGIRPKVKLVKEHPYIDDRKRKYQVLYDRCYDRKFDNSAIAEYIDVSSFQSTEQGLRQCLRTFIRNNKSCDFYLDPLHEGKYDRITGEIMSLKNYTTLRLKLLYLQQRFFPSSLPIIRKIKSSISSFFKRN